MTHPLRRSSDRGRTKKAHGKEKITIEEPPPEKTKADVHITADEIRDELDQLLDAMARSVHHDDGGIAITTLKERLDHIEAYVRQESPGMGHLLKRIVRAKDHFMDMVRSKRDLYNEIESIRSFL